MDVFRMHCFVCVAKCRNLSHAAQEMFITQPAMTAQMNALEKEMGAQLLNRGKTTTLTVAGEQALEAFQAILDRYDDLVKDLQVMGDGSYGKVRFGFCGPFASARVDLLMGQFRTRYPNIEINVTMGTWYDLC